uniref:DUF7725 domain-containing protein n=1 Tax=Aegilops tauschii subsp. strangulata TaxID=200361 RepID=A0A452YIQ0_AEGTS
MAPKKSITKEEAERIYMLCWISYVPVSGDIRRIPPRRIVLYPDIFQTVWGWDRLLPHDIECEEFYFDYLRQYYERNRLDYVAAADGQSKPQDWPLKAPPEGVPKCIPNGKHPLAAAAKHCLKMEVRFMSVWKDRPIHNVKELSEKIQERVSRLIILGREFSEPAAASLVCIANEASLARELLRRGAKANDKEINLCNCIRHCALSLMFMSGPHSEASAAAMVGVAKEARKICEWMKSTKECCVFRSYSRIHELCLCDEIRVATFDVLKHILSNSTGGKEPFVLMDFAIKRNRRKHQNTMEGTSDESLLHEPRHEGKSVLGLGDNNGEFDARMIAPQMDLLREQTNGLANSRRESDNSAVERAHHLKPILGIREHLSEKENQVLAPEEQEQCYEGKNLELGDNNGKLDALMIDHETDLLREQKTKGLANSRRESDNSEVERAHHIKPVLGIREHLSEKDNQGEKGIVGKQSVEQVSSTQRKASYCTISTTQNHLNSISVGYKPNIVNQADMLTPDCGQRIPKHPALLDKRSLLACIARAVSASHNNQTKISSTLPNRLGKMLAPLHWRDYRKDYGKLDDFLAEHQELFVIEGDFVHLREEAEHITRALLLHTS